MHDISSLLPKLVCINGQGHYIAVFDAFFTVTASLSVIESAMSNNAFGIVRQICITNHISDVVMLVIPNKRDSLAVTVLKSVMSDDSSI